MDGSQRFLQLLVRRTKQCMCYNYNIYNQDGERHEFCNFRDILLMNFAVPLACYFVSSILDELVSVGLYDNSHFAL